MDDKKFKELYADLNKGQKEAVDSIEGPVLVMAGPGTGKTQILALRVANILRTTDTAPEQILSLTFTDAGVSAMRSRLSSIIGVTAYCLPIFTFHGFCNEIIFRFSEYFPELMGSRPASELDKITLMRKVFDSVSLKKLSSFRSPYYYLTSVLSAVSLLKREAIAPDDLRMRLDAEEKEIKSMSDYLHEKGPCKGKVKGIYLERQEAVAKNRELTILYEKYEDLLAREKLYDFDDMILHVICRLKGSEELRLILQEEYQYILADEHQDANGGQNNVLEFLTSFHERPNLFIVGDDKQAIYRFQGASIQNFLYFKNKFPDLKIISLEENYRSSQTILNVAEALLSGEKKLIAKSKHKELPIRIKSFVTEDDESDEIAKEIYQKISNGVAPEQIAIFTRRNSELALYSGALSRAGVPFSIQSKDDALDDQHIEKLLVILEAVAKVGDDLSLYKALHMDCFGIPELDIFTLAREASREKKSVWDIVSSGKKLDALGLLQPKELFTTVSKILSWAKLGQNVSLAELVSIVARESGIVYQIISTGDLSIDKFAKLSKLLSYLGSYQISHRHARLPELLGILDLLDEYNILEVSSSDIVPGRVRLSTAHRAKGLEFDYIYIVGAREGNWSGARSPVAFKLPGIVSVDKNQEEDDDRRLFYVAITRARRELCISYSTNGKDGKLFLPTRFIDEFPQGMVTRENIVSVITPEILASRLSGGPPGGSKLDVKNFVKETLALRGLAVTGLNNYLRCPWQYFYRNLLRIPEAQTTPLMFGNAVHRTLKFFFDAFAQGNNLSKKDLILRFKQELEKEAMTDKEFNEAFNDGEVALSGYYNNYSSNWERNIKNEFSIDASFVVGDFNLRLTGKLDKMEFLGNQSVRVVDYKTGKPKTRNFIEGKTKERGSGDYKRQLTFYKLLLDRYEDGKFEMQSGIIDFIEPGDNGKYRREEFEITNAETKELKETVEEVTKELLGLSFWNKTCGDQECEYCKLREMVK